MSRETCILLTAGNCNWGNWSLAVVCGHTVVCFSSVFVCICVHSEEKVHAHWRIRSSCSNFLLIFLQNQSTSWSPRGWWQVVWWSPHKNGSESAISFHICEFSGKCSGRETIRRTARLFKRLSGSTMWTRPGNMSGPFVTWCELHCATSQWWLQKGPHCFSC